MVKNVYAGKNIYGYVTKSYITDIVAHDNSVMDVEETIAIDFLRDKKVYLGLYL